MGKLQKLIKQTLNPPENRDKSFVWEGLTLEEKLLWIIEEMKKEFPIEFWCDVVTEEVEQGNSKIERQRMPNASLPKYRANAIINKDKVIDWFIEWLL